MAWQSFVFEPQTHVGFKRESCCGMSRFPFAFVIVFVCSLFFFFCIPVSSFICLAFTISMHVYIIGASNYVGYSH